MYQEDATGSIVDSTEEDEPDGVGCVRGLLINDSGTSLTLQIQT